jgi:hypothetical protein|tara:strand:+ start:2793 stop:3047 length:255 start_codon:yes stop_codon:yes gene_type:complete
MSINDEWRNFIVEGTVGERSIFTYLQGLQELISNFKPKTLTEKRRLSLAEGQLREARKLARQMQGSIDVLQERLTILEESKDIG